MDLKESIRELVAQAVSEELDSSASLPESQALGIFDTIDQAAAAAKESQRILSTQGLEQRRSWIAAMRETAVKQARLLGEMAAEETGMGGGAYKETKNILAARETPGVEDLETAAYTSEHGLALIERAPYGVIGAITPSTNPTATIISNAIGMIAGGNAVVFNPHPGAKNCSQRTVSLLNQAVADQGGPPHLITAIKNPTIHSAGELMAHKDLPLLVVTGGPGVVKAAMAHPKKVIAAGPGNPPCVVDETANIPKAARDIVNGAGFDHNIICICEKEVLVTAAAAAELTQEMSKNNAFFLNAPQTQAITDLVIKEPGGPGKEGIPNKAYVGKSPRTIASAVGIQVPQGTRLLACRVGENHPLVWTEQLMPVLPVVSLPHVDACIELARRCEHGFRHTAMMHSRNVEKLTLMARQMNCSLFVKNGPSYAGLAKGGAGFTSFTIASPTGEGLTRARTFTRERRCTLVDHFRIV